MKWSAKSAVVFVCLLMFTAVPRPMLAQIPPDRDGLLKAEDTGETKYAEENGYPGPKRVLELAAELQLTPAQRQSVLEVEREMTTRAKDLGQRIIDYEKDMQKAFKDGLVTDKSVESDAEEIGRLRGKLRAVHLNAHLKTKGLLTAQQIAAYKKLKAGEKNH